MNLKSLSGVLCAAFVVMPVFAADPAPGASAAPISTEAFFRRPLYTSVTISPGGKYLALVGPVKGDETQTQLYFVDLQSRQVKGNYVLRGQEQVSQIWWFADDRVLFSTVVKTGSFDQLLRTGELWQTDVAGKNVKRISYGGTVLAVSRERPGHVITGGWGSARVWDLSDVRHDTKLSGNFDANISGWPTFDNSENLRLVSGLNIKTAAPKFLTHRQATRDWDDHSSFVDGEDRYSEFGPVQFTADDKQFYYKGVTPDGTLGLYVVDPVTLKKQLLYSDPDYDIDYTFSNTDWLDGVNGKTLVAFQYQAELPQWIVVKKDAPEASMLAGLQDAFAGEAVRITSTTWDGSKAVVYVYSDTDPGQYFLYDAKTQKVEFMFASRPDIKPAQMAEMKPITFKARDGLTLHGYLTLPKGGNKGLPLIVHPHGGPFGIRDEWGFDPEVQFLAYHGYAVLQVEFRGSGGYGNAFMEAGYRQWGGAMQDDLTDATRWVVQQGVADPKRICIYGVSYGGYAALEGVEKEPDLYRCAVGYAGVYDLVKERDKAGYLHGQTLGPFMERTLGDDKDVLRANSPYLHVDKIKADLFLAHGGADHTVDPSNADELRDALDDIKKPYEWVYYRNEGHGFYALDHQVDVYTKMLAFFDKYIGPGAAQPATPVTKAP